MTIPRAEPDVARRKKGRDISGWVVVDKPAGMSSTNVVGKVRWAFNANKAGHAGTLDPEATGILAVALGEATKTVPFVTDAQKAYEFTVKFGEATNTDDTEGEVIATSDTRPSDAEIEAALPAFVGDLRTLMTLMLKPSCFNRSTTGIDPWHAEPPGPE